MNFVIGAGSIGRRHILNLLASGEVVSVFDPDPVARRAVSGIGNISLLENSSEIFESAKRGDRLFICSPPDTHIEYAVCGAEKGLDIFIEKPVSCNTRDMDKLIGIIEKNDIVSMVACNMRFDNILAKVKSMLSDSLFGKIYAVFAAYSYDLRLWRPGTDYSKNYAVFEETGGGVVLDCIHEMDYICWLLEDKPVRVSSLLSKVSGLSINTEDIAVIGAEFSKGVVAGINLGYISPVYMRECKIVAEKGVLEWRFSPEFSKLRYVVDGKENFLEDKKFDLNDMYVRELKHFLECCCGRKETLNTVKDAFEVLKFALNVKKSGKRRDKVL